MAYKFFVDLQTFEQESQFITGAQIKALRGVPANYGVWLRLRGPEEDIEILDNEQVDLARPGKEHFFTGSKTTTEG